MPKMRAGYIRDLYPLISILWPHHCLSSLVLLHAQPSRNRAKTPASAGGFKINRVILSGKHLDVFYIHIIYNKLYFTPCYVICVSTFCIPGPRLK